MRSPAVILVVLALAHMHGSAQTLRRIDGFVTDATVGVAEANVRLTCGSNTAEANTAGDGSFAFDVAVIGTCTITVSKSERTLLTRVIEVGASESRLDLEIQQPASPSRLMHEATFAIDSVTPEPNSKAERDSRPTLRIDFAAIPQSAHDVLDTTHDPTAFGTRDRLWEFRSGGAYGLGKGVVASAHVIGRRGYRLPLYVSDLLGANQSSVDIANTSIVDLSQFNVDWTAKMRIEKRLVQRKWDMRVVGELMAPLGRTDRTVVNPSTGILSSRAIRVGLVLGF
jgi:hypothetical protein